MRAVVFLSTALGLVSLAARAPAQSAGAPSGLGPALAISLDYDGRGTVVARGPRLPPIVREYGSPPLVLVYAPAVTAAPAPRPAAARRGRTPAAPREPSGSARLPVLCDYEGHVAARPLAPGVALPILREFGAALPPLAGWTDRDDPTELPPIVVTPGAL